MQLVSVRDLQSKDAQSGGYLNQPWQAGSQRYITMLESEVPHSSYEDHGQ